MKQPRSKPSPRMLTPEQPVAKTIGLCMIVKNESRVILRGLESIRPLIDYVLVEDTGSTDGTQAIIRDWLKREGLPGEVFDEPWQDFAYNRSVALARLREVAGVDYAFVLDADDQVVIGKGFDVTAFKAALSRDVYRVELRHGSTRYHTSQICNNRRRFRYRGVLHEFMEGPQDGVSSGLATGFHILSGREGARSQVADKYEKDAKVLAGALVGEKDPFLRSRYQFYLARSYRDAGEKEQALDNFLKRAEMGHWREEVFESLYSAAELMRSLGRPFDDVMAMYSRASDAVPSRAEALHGASRFCRENSKFAEGFAFAERGLKIPPPADGLFVQSWVYDYGLLDELAVNAYWIGRYEDSLKACRRLVDENKMPADMGERVRKNAAFAAGKVNGPDAWAQPGNEPSLENPIPEIGPKQARRLKIAVYTIALNEAHHAERWRLSAADADYLVVADTGSTDDTVERLLRCGVRVHQIVIRPWRFDDARNASLALVPQDTDICVCLDMDEFLLPGWRAAVEAAWRGDTTRLSYNFAPQYDENGTDTHKFRKSKIHSRWGYRWKRIVHEDLQRTGPAELETPIDALLIGQSQDLAKTRSQYLPMLERAHAEDPSDSQICFWLARDLMYAGLNERSAEKYQAYLALPASTWPEERSEALRFLARVQPDRRLEWLQKSLIEAPHRREVWLDLAEFYHGILDWQNLYAACLAGMEKTRYTGSYLDDRSAWGYRLCDLAALACSHLGLATQGVNWGTRAVEQNPGDERLANNLAYYRSQMRESAPPQQAAANSGQA